MVESNRTRWSHYLICAIMVALPLERIPSLHVLFGASPITIRISQVLALVLVGLNVPLLWSRRRDWLTGPWPWLLAFIVVMLVSTGLALSKQRALLVTAYTTFDILIAYLVSMYATRERLALYIKLLLAAAVAACLFGLYQFFGDLLKLPTWVTGLRERYTKAVFGFPRIQSTALEPLYFADYLLIPASIAAVYFLEKSRRYGWLALLFFAMITLTVSRGALVALAIALLLCVCLALVRRQYRLALSVIGIAIASAGLALGLIFVAGKINSQAGSKSEVKNFTHQTTNFNEGESVESRIFTRNAAIQAFKTHPLLGVGPGNFGYYAHRTQPQQFADNAAIVNNEPLELLAETGIIGFAIIIGFAVSLLIVARKKFSFRTPAWTTGISLLIALVAIAAQYQTFSTLYITHVWVTAGLLLGASRTAKGPSV